MLLLSIRTRTLTAGAQIPVFRESERGAHPSWKSSRNIHRRRPKTFPLLNPDLPDEHIVFFPPSGSVLPCCDTHTASDPFYDTENSESLYLQLSEEWLVNPKLKHRYLNPVGWVCFSFLLWRRPGADVWLRDDKWSRLTFLRSPTGFRSENSIQGHGHLFALFLGQLQYQLPP